MGCELTLRLNYGKIKHGGRKMKPRNEREKRKIVCVQKCENPYFSVYEVRKLSQNSGEWYSRGRICRGVKALWGYLMNRDISPLFENGIVNDLRLYIKDIKRKAEEHKDKYGIESRV